MSKLVTLLTLKILRHNGLFGIRLVYPRILTFGVRGLGYGLPSPGVPSRWGRRFRRVHEESSQVPLGTYPLGSLSLRYE